MNTNNCEWWSDCCTAPPLYELHDLDNKEIPDVIGICMCCREHTSFQCQKEECEEKKESIMYSCEDGEEE